MGFFYIPPYWFQHECFIIFSIVADNISLDCCHVSIVSRKLFSRIGNRVWSRKMFCLNWWFCLYSTIFFKNFILIFLTYFAFENYIHRAKKKVFSFVSLSYFIPIVHSNFIDFIMTRRTSKRGQKLVLRVLSIFMNFFNVLALNFAVKRSSKFLLVAWERLELTRNLPLRCLCRCNVVLVVLFGQVELDVCVLTLKLFQESWMRVRSSVKFHIVWCIKYLIGKSGFWYNDHSLSA